MAPHLLSGNSTHVKNCTNLMAGSGNGTMNSVGVGNRIPQGNYFFLLQLYEMVL